MHIEQNLPQAYQSTYVTSALAQDLTISNL